MPLPPQTPEQRAGALAKATEVRQARSALLAQVKAGELTPGQVFERTDDEVVKKTRVAQVLRALPGYGPATVTALMTASGVDERRRVGGLTGGQRERLLEAVTASRADDRAPDAREQAEAAESSGGDQDGTPKPQSPGILRRAGAALKGVVETGQQAGEQATALSPLGAALKETVTRLVGTLRELLLTVRGLVQIVVALLRLILATLRDVLGAVVGKVAGVVSS